MKARSLHVYLKELYFLPKGRRRKLIHFRFLQHTTMLCGCCSADQHYLRFKNLEKYRLKYFQNVFELAIPLNFLFKTYKLCRNNHSKFQ